MPDCLGNKGVDSSCVESDAKKTTCTPVSDMPDFTPERSTTETSDGQHGPVTLEDEIRLTSPKEEILAHDFRAADEPPSIQTILSNRIAERGQMVNTFMWAYCSSSLGPKISLSLGITGNDKDHKGHASLFPSTLTSLADLPDSPLLSQGIETLCLAYLAQSKSSPRVATRARDACVRFVRDVQHALDRAARVHDKVRSREVLMAILLASLIALSRDAHALQLPLGTGLIHHDSASHFLHQQGPHLLSTTSPFDRALHQNILTLQLLRSIALRRPLPFTPPEFRSHIRSLEEDPAIASARAWQRDLEDLPEVLAEIDTITDATDDESLQTLYQELLTIRTRLLPYAKWAKIPAHVSTQDRDRFAVTGNPIHRFLLRPDRASTISILYDFDSPTHGRNKILSWVMMLIIECAMLRLLHFRPRIQLLPGVEMKADVEARGLSVAIDLCRAVWFLGRDPSILAYMNFLRLVVGTADVFFEEMGDSMGVREKEWTTQCLRIVVEMTAELERRGKRTLCAMTELREGLARNCRWRRAIEATGDG